MILITGGKQASSDRIYKGELAARGHDTVVGRLAGLGRKMA